MTDHLAVLEEIAEELRVFGDDLYQGGAVLHGFADRITAATALMRGQSWQPIETSPKDGGSFLVWCPDRKNTYMVTANAGHGFRVFGGYELCEEASHWQPRPAPPKEPAE